jgi:hypothetical protein
MAGQGRGKRNSQFEIIVVLVRANPEPEVIAIPLTSESPITASNFRRVNGAFLLESQGGMSRVGSKKPEILVGEIPDPFGQLLITFPKGRQRV